jgi:hypothetical protein
MNTTERVQHYRIGVSGLAGMRTDFDGTVVTVDPAQARWVPVAARVAPETAAAAGRGSHPIDFTVERIVDTPADSPRSVVEHSTFVVPR